ncbi:hypothetical protein Fcan01_15774 [Folsomia candida]|uniref:Uncharacterized protein n=1 Tax=Folsomia candida TaxID=158441 RepID=A0A226DZQ7_FOLCA|nr:hypothetical protein Fcan01_15774 [Folsomia candida]
MGGGTHFRFRPPFRGPGPPPGFMGGPPPPRPPFFDGPPRPRMFHPRHGNFPRYGPPPPYFNNGPGPGGGMDEFSGPPYFEREMCPSLPDVVMRDPYGDNFPPPPTRRLPRSTPQSQAWREDRVLRNPHAHTKPEPPPPKQPPKVNKVQPLMDIPLIFVKVCNDAPGGSIDTCTKRNRAARVLPSGQSRADGGGEDNEANHTPGEIYDTGGVAIIVCATECPGEIDDTHPTGCGACKFYATDCDTIKINYCDTGGGVAKINDAFDNRTAVDEINATTKTNDIVPAPVNKFCFVSGVKIDHSVTGDDDTKRRALSRRRL